MLTILLINLTFPTYFSQTRITQNRFSTPLYISSFTFSIIGWFFKETNDMTYQKGDNIRRCDKCGEDKEVRGGKTCENGHFICSSCVYGGFFSSTLKSCPLCEKPLR